jgi:hypothetical protein
LIFEPDFEKQGLIFINLELFGHSTEQLLVHGILRQQDPIKFVGQHFAQVFCFLQHLLRVKALNSKLISPKVDNLHLCFWPSVLAVSAHWLFNFLVREQGGLRYLATVVRYVVVRLAIFKVSTAGILWLWKPDFAWARIDVALSLVSNCPSHWYTKVEIF